MWISLLCLHMGVSFKWYEYDSHNHKMHLDIYRQIVVYNLCLSFLFEYNLTDPISLGLNYNFSINSFAPFYYL